jgi:hypothetical protein
LELPDILLVGWDGISAPSEIAKELVNGGIDAQSCIASVGSVGNSFHFLYLQVIEKMVALPGIEPGFED